MNQNDENVEHEQRKQDDLDARPTILSLLKDGCMIKFPSGYYISGDLSTGYIDTGYESDGQNFPDGLRPLDEDGVLLALNDEKHFKK